MTLTKLTMLSVLMISTYTVQAASEHDNEVTFQVNGITGFSFTETSHSITSGQPYSGASGSVDGSKGKITVKAGRKGSSSVASWFAQQVGTGGTIACDSAGSLPDELNFAVQGTMTITQGDKVVTCDNIIVGQGHFLTTNNWWVGGPNMGSPQVPFVGPATQICKNQNGVPTPVIFTPQTPCASSFNAAVQ